MNTFLYIQDFDPLIDGPECYQNLPGKSGLNKIVGGDHIWALDREGLLVTLCVCCAVAQRKAFYCVVIKSESYTVKPGDDLFVNEHQIIRVFPLGQDLQRCDRRSARRKVVALDEYRRTRVQGE